MNFIKFISSQEPVASWPATRKKKFLDRFCEARGYDPMPDPETGEPTVTQFQFFNRDITSYITTMVDGRAREEALLNLEYEKTDLDA